MISKFLGWGEWKITNSLERIKFDNLIQLPDSRTGKKFKVGGDRNYQPVCDRF